jgi:hypothetical protein
MHKVTSNFLNRPPHTILGDDLNTADINAPANLGTPKATMLEDDYRC